ncbi:hypothetical protein [Pseudoalteromonas sp. A22]|uniref:hypothetical protein n=1 Tax=Pseudoalteromonas sp. A22 TaxID=327511 RepID=UPI001BADE929|nr:hypothetical protein [Pseudoalteromonas sp. A22]
MPVLLVRFAIFTLIASVLLLSVNHVYGLAVVMFISGLAFAPTMIIAMGLVEQSVPKRLLTEALTWLITGLGVGLQVGCVDRMGR